MSVTSSPCCIRIAQTLRRNLVPACTRDASSGLISAGHDRSDGGLATTLLEMAFAGEIGCGLDVDVPGIAADAKSGTGSSTLDTLFAEEASTNSFGLRG